MGIDLCDMMDGPVSVWTVLVEFAIFVALAVLAGRLTRATASNTRWWGRALITMLVVICVQNSLMLAQWGLVSDVKTCTAFTDDVTIAILISSNLAVVGAWWMTKSRGL